MYLNINFKINYKFLVNYNIDGKYSVDKERIQNLRILFDEQLTSIQNINEIQRRLTTDQSKMTINRFPINTKLHFDDSSFPIKIYYSIRKWNTFLVLFFSIN